MKAKNIVLSRLLPKTGQTQSYHSGDDGEYEAGWWRGLLNADNKTRFIAKTLNGDDVVIDLATGLMWAARGNEEGGHCGNLEYWHVAIDYALGLTFAGFSDWRLPNVKELMSIVDYSLSNPAIKEPPFYNIYAAVYWSSTTYAQTIALAWGVDLSIGSVYNVPKMFDYNLLCVRGGL